MLRLLNIVSNRRLQYLSFVLFDNCTLNYQASFLRDLRLAIFRT